MNDERDHDGEKIKKYYGPRKTTSVEQYASANLNNNAFANEDSAVKPKENATGEGPSKVMDIKPIPPTGKKTGDGKKIKTVDTPPKKEASPIPIVAETAEKEDEPKTETSIEPPQAETPVKEEPTKTPQENDGSYVPIGVDITPSRSPSTMPGRMRPQMMVRVLKMRRRLPRNSTPMRVKMFSPRRKGPSSTIPLQGNSSPPGSLPSHPRG